MTTPFTQLDKDRFNAWFDHDTRLPELANELDTTVLELAEWARQPHVAEALENVATVARQRHATLRAEAQHAATARLLRITRFCDHDEIARRAADRLLRSLPAGERPLDDEPDITADISHDKDVHATQPPPRPVASVPSPRTPSISVPVPHAAPADPLSAPAPPGPPPTFKLTQPDPVLQRTNEIVAAVLDAADKAGIDPEEFDDPSVLEDLLDDLNFDLDDVDIDDLQDAIDDALLDRSADEFEQTHGIPITHPAIRQAIADLLIDDIPAIAATLRANAPPNSA